MSEQENLSTRVALVEKEFGVVNDMFRRFETAVDKMSEVTVSLQRVLAIHERRHDEHETATARLQELIERRRDDAERNDRLYAERLSALSNDFRIALREEIGGLSNDIDTRIDAVSDRVGALEKWRWLIIGGAAAIGFLSSKLPPIISFLGTGG